MLKMIFVDEAVKHARKVIKGALYLPWSRSIRAITIVTAHILAAISIRDGPRRISLAGTALTRITDIRVSGANGFFVTHRRIASVVSAASLVAVIRQGKIHAFTVPGT